MKVDPPIKVVRKESAGKKYDNCRQMNVHRYSDDPCLTRAIKRLMEIIGYDGYKQKRQCNVLVIDLYHCYKGDKKRYIKFYLSPNSYERIKRYNPFYVTFDIIKNLTQKLSDHGYIEVTKGFNDTVTKHNESSKMIALPKLISFLEDDFGVKPSMVKTHKEQEVIILKDYTKKVFRNGRLIKIKPKKDYKDEDNAIIKKMRKIVNKYNLLLANTYIDLDIYGFKYVRKIRKADKNNVKKHEPLRIDLSIKRVYRVFTGDFEHGGRWYGPWWQGCPEALRSRIIINGSHTVEFDFSGLHIHLLYALKRLKLGDREPYIVSKGNDPDKLRKIYKLIMLTSVNCGSDPECIAAVEDQLVDEMEEEPDKYPDKMPDLEAMLKELREYHKPIDYFINKKTGLKLQYIDSSIVEEVIMQMTDKNIPVLSVHDSFICREEDAETVHLAMKEAFVKCIMKVLGGNRTKFKINAEEIATTICKESEIIFPAYKRLSNNNVPKEHIASALSKQAENTDKYSNYGTTKANKLLTLNAINTTKIKFPRNRPSFKQLKHVTWIHVFNNNYATRLREYELTNNPEVNVVIRIKPQVEYINNKGGSSEEPPTSE